jgi:hypothetical protein
MKTGPLRIGLVVLVTTFPVAIRAQRQNPNYDRCEVVVDTGQKVPPVLGSFETIMGEEELTVRAFRLPGTKLFVVASVFYTDESMAADESSDSMKLELALSRHRQRDPSTSLNFAMAELPASVKVGRVIMMVKLKGKQRPVLMECRRELRP